MAAGIRQGWQTSEFWITLITTIIPLILNLVGKAQADVAFPVAAVGASYILGRSYVKAKN
jgi:hypothetical protein